MAQLETIESYRRLLFTIAYQITGHASTAEDIVQETYLRHQQAHPEEGIQSLKAYLSTIATRLAIDYVKSAQHTRESYMGTWLPEPILTSTTNPLDEIVEQHEAVSLALLVLLETLTPPERAVFLLHEVLDFTYAEIAPIVDKSVAACRQVCHRAQHHLAAKQRHFTVSHEAQQRLVTNFLLACQNGQFDALLHDLARDVTLWSDGGGKVPVAGHPLQGAAIIARFFLGLARKGASQQARVAIDEVNAAPALLIWEHEIVTTVMVFATDGAQIHGIYSQRNPDKLRFIQHQLDQRTMTS